MTSVRERLAMPANLTIQYHAAEKRFKEARTHEEKIGALQEMLSVIPKHKGTDHLQADIKRRLSQLRKEGPKKGGAHRHVASPYAIGRAGAGQVVVIGPPNSGKSSLVAAVTHARVEIADYPFSTPLPVPGMMDFDSIRIQLIDTPPILEGACDPELAQLLHRADLALLVLSASDPDVLEQVEIVERELDAHHVQLVTDPEHAQEIKVVGGAVRSLAVITGTDREGGSTGLELLRELIGARLPIFVVTPTDAQALDTFRWQVWRRLGAVRVFTKEPGKKPDLGEPFFLSAGQTVIDLAFKIHKDVGRNLEFARLWGAGVHDGQRVPRDHVLHDGDIVELHA